MPTGADSSIIYGTVFTLVVWVVIGWLLLRLAGVELRRNRRADQPPGGRPSQ